MSDRDVLTPKQVELCETSETDYSDLRAMFINCTLKRSPEVSQHPGPDGHLDRDHAPQRRRGRLHPRDRPPDRDRRLARHDRARLGGRRVARDLRAGDGGRHPRPRDVDLARREVVGRALRSSSACTATRTCSTTHGQYAYYGRVGGCLVTGNEDGVKHCAMNIALLAAAPRLHDPAAGRRRLDRRGRARPFLPRRGLGRSGERLHQPQHDLRDLEHAPPRADAQGRRRDPDARQPAHGVGCRLSLRLPQSGVPGVGRASLVARRSRDGR